MKTPTPSFQCRSFMIWSTTRAKVAWRPTCNSAIWIRTSWSPQWNGASVLPKLIGHVRLVGASCFPVCSVCCWAVFEIESDDLICSESRMLAPQNIFFALSSFVYIWNYIDLLKRGSSDESKSASSWGVLRLNRLGNISKEIGFSEAFFRFSNNYYLCDFLMGRDKHQSQCCVEQRFQSLCR